MLSLQQSIIIKLVYMKKIILRLWPQPTSKWLEQMIDNVGMQKDFADEKVINVLKKAHFSEKEMELLVIDLNHSASHTRYNSTTNNGTNYDHKVYKRYLSLVQIADNYCNVLKRVSQ